MGGLKSSCSPFTQQQALYGRALVELFSVRCKGGGSPSWTIIVYDGKRGQTIYRDNGRADQAVSHKPSSFGAQNGNNSHPLLLTGPYRVISLDGCVVIAFSHDNRCHGEILLDVEDPSTTYDKAITEVVRTCTCPEHPPAVVTYALLSNAVQATVQVRLLKPRDDTIYGKIVARTDLGEVLLFESNNDNTRTQSSHEPTIIPLARSVLAVSLTSALQIDVDLCCNTGKIVNESVTCQATLNSDHVLCLGENGQVELKITWSD